MLHSTKFRIELSGESARVSDSPRSACRAALLLANIPNTKCPRNALGDRGVPINGNVVNGANSAARFSCRFPNTECEPFRSSQTELAVRRAVTLRDASFRSPTRKASGGSRLFFLPETLSGVDVSAMICDARVWPDANAVQGSISTPPGVPCEAHSLFHLIHRTGVGPDSLLR